MSSRDDMLKQIDTRARQLLRPIRGCATDEQYQEVVSAVKEALQSAFNLGFEASVMPHIICPRCGAISYHPKDKEEGYCGRCHAFTSDTTSRTNP